ncbi:DUF3574 domain-containing protein [Streptomyces sp. NBC_01497]|uniref:DUF3574 domain-containing protein n=1 Tax=Streptomyces sp. NBC_01497 TaxID=2903885 RepID=UPI002E306FC2|nr:DUF3574 domain-containing protein [Streptomyces sp. NBC_01497]
MTTFFLPHRSSLLALGCAVTALFGVGAPSSYTGLDSGSAARHSAHRTSQDTPPGAGRPAVPAAPRGAEPPAAAYTETRLFFGTERPDGGPAVTEAQFAAFVDREVTPSFPEGLTVQDGRGQWRDAHGTIERERSHELILLYPRSEAARRDGAIERARAAYVRTYAQDSVARLDEPARADF